MISYNVTIKVDNDISEEWMNWMQNEHLPDLMKTGCFTGCKLFRLLDQDEIEGITYSAQYFCENMDNYNAYITDHAGVLRDKILNKFGGKFAAFRTVMELVVEKTV